MFKKGDRVYYVSGVHGALSNNPLIDTKYECQGSVREIRDSGFSISVRWDNGTSNSYNSGDLVHADIVINRPLPKTDPNSAFRIKKKRLL